MQEVTGYLLRETIAFLLTRTLRTLQTAQVVDCLQH
jgi:hypothetical protein